MEPFSRFPPELCRNIRFVLTDIDDTLTRGGRLHAATYEALEREHAYREITVAIEFETRAAHMRDAPAVAERLAEQGANAAVNSLWVIGWFGGFDKLAMARKMTAEVFVLDLSLERDNTIFVGDSANDEPMFEFFRHSVGVSTVRAFLPQTRSPPRWVTDGPGGDGFVEVADRLLRDRRPVR